MIIIYRMYDETCGYTRKFTMTHNRNYHAVSSLSDIDKLLISDE